MSGTPVENRLSEFWSIMDFSNRGILGSAKDFKENYSTQIETYNNVETANKLQKVTSPFMMRRLKTDKSIISDLPDKIEMDCLLIIWYTYSLLPAELDLRVHLFCGMTILQPVPSVAMYRFMILKEQ